MSKKRKRGSETSIANTTGSQKIAESSDVKRNRSYNENDASLAKVFEDLSSDVQAARLEAAANLVSKATGDNTRLYIRLIRGLCSSRKSARLGFFTAFTELLAQDSRWRDENNFQKSVQELVDLIQKHTEPESGCSGQEKRDYSIGRASAYNSLIHSKTLFQPKARKSQKCIRLVMEEQCKLANSVPWLREQCLLSLYESVQIMSQLDKDGFSGPASALIEILRDHHLTISLEGAAIWLQIRQSLPETKMPEKIWPKNDPLAPKSLTKIAESIKGARNQNASSITGLRQISPSFAWNVILEHAVHLQNSGNNREVGLSNQCFTNVWGELVDRTLFSSSASAERKSIGLQVLSSFMSTASMSFLSHSLTPNVMKCLVNQTSEPERYLHKAAKALLGSITSRVRNEPRAGADAYAGFMSNGDAVNFDKLTSTKTIHHILLLADEISFTKIVKECLRLILRPNTSEQKAAEFRRQILADQLLHALRVRSAESGGFKTSVSIGFKPVLNTLATVGFLVSKDNSQNAPFPELSLKSRNIFKDRLISCMGVATSIIPEEINDLAIAVLTILKEGDKCGWVSVFDADQKVQEAVSQAHELLGVVNNLEVELPRQQILKSFIALTLIQVYGGESEAVLVLEDLSNCYFRLIGSDMSQNEALNEVMDFIMNFASRPSAMYRKLAESAFAAFSSSMTLKALESLLEILKQRENVAGQEALFDQVDVNENDETDGEDDGTSSSDASEKSARDEKSDEEDDGEHDENEEDAAELEEFDKKLASLLQTKILTEDVNTGDESSSEDMDDDQMMAMDPTIERHFKELKSATNQKKNKADARQNMINFKNRVLDFLLIYVKKQHSNALSLNLILPLTQLIRATQNPGLAQKSSQLLHQFYDACKRHGMPESIDSDGCFRLLEALHSEARQNASKLHAAACSSSCLFMCRLLTAQNATNFEKIGSLYMKSLGNKALKLPKALYYTDFSNWAFNMELN